MERSQQSALRSLAAPLYAVAVLAVVFPLGDLLMNVLPLRFGVVQWRIGVIGLVSAYTLTPLLGLALALVLAALLGQPRVLRIAGWLCVLAAIMLLAGVGLFLLDTLQLWHSIPAQRQALVLVATAKATAKNLIAVLAFLWAGLGALAARRRIALPMSAAGAWGAGPGLVVGAPPPAARAAATAVLEDPPPGSGAPARPSTAPAGAGAPVRSDAERPGRPGPR